jgi:hypothetical protein
MPFALVPAPPPLSISSSLDGDGPRLLIAYPVCPLGSVKRRKNPFFLASEKDLGIGMRNANL